MIRTVIVDDEVLATVGLKAMIDWGACGFELAGEAENGEAGLELIRRVRPDVVITDIMMPRMDGLEMMRRVLAEQPGIRFVVLSGYNEFQLVRTALTLGARDYLLKLSLRPETLLETLETLRRDFPAERSDTSAGLDAAGPPNGVSAGSPVPAGEVPPRGPADSRTVRRELRRAVEGFAEPGRTAALLRPLGFGDETELRLAFVRTFPRGTEPADAGGEGMGSVVAEMVGKLAAEFGRAFCFPWDEGGYLLLLGLAPGTPGRTGQDLLDIGGSIVQMLAQYVNLDAAVGFSGDGGSMEQLPQAFRQAEAASGRSFYEGFGQVFPHDGQESAPIRTTLPEQECAERIALAVAHADSARLQEGFDRMLSRIRSARPPRAEALECVCRMLEHVDAELGESWSGRPGRSAHELRAVVLRLRTVDGLARFLTEYRAAVAERLAELRRNSTQDIILRARRHIADNITRRVSLRETASRLHVSAGYLSTLFPRVTGMRFSDYVNQAKIREAQDMIRSGRLRVFEVADALAFQTPSYFSKMFRRFAGCSPSEYARRTRMEREPDDRNQA
ncbi:MAG: response regulator [Clostridia bacterium]|nr:response regulator [Clostridia bacterium]